MWANTRRVATQRYGFDKLDVFLEGLFDMDSDGGSDGDGNDNDDHDDGNTGKMKELLLGQFLVTMIFVLLRTLRRYPSLYALQKPAPLHRNYSTFVTRTSSYNTIGEM